DAVRTREHAQLAREGDHVGARATGRQVVQARGRDRHDDVTRVAARAERRLRRLAGQVQRPWLDAAGGIDDAYLEDGSEDAKRVEAPDLGLAALGDARLEDLVHDRAKLRVGATLRVVVAKVGLRAGRVERHQLGRVVGRRSDEAPVGGLTER